MQKNISDISIIGLRGYPSEFIGTSGVEAYVEQVILRLLKKDKKLNFLVYSKTNYRAPKNRCIRVIIKPVYTLSSRVFESIIYALLASIYSAFDDSKVIWFQGMGMALFAFLPRLCGKRVVVTVHAPDWERKKWSKSERIVFYFVAKMTSCFGNRYSAVSRFLVKQLKKDFNIKAVFTPPGFFKFERNIKYSKLDKLGLEKDKYLLYLGRIVPEKRIEWLIESYLKLKMSYPGQKLVIAGGHGNMPAYEQSLINKYQNSDILWLGYVFGSLKKALLGAASCLVIPSELEGSSISFMEGISFGKRCVIPVNFVEKEFLYLENVIVFKKKDRKSFEEGLKKALVTQNHRNQKLFSREIFRKTEFTWENTAVKYCSILQ